MSDRIDTDGLDQANADDEPTLTMSLAYLTEAVPGVRGPSVYCHKCGLVAIGGSRATLIRALELHVEAHDDRRRI